MKKTITFLGAIGILTLLFLLSCEDNSVEPDTQSPELEFTYPLNNSVVGDTISFKVSATDNEGVTRVEFYVDDSHMVDADDESEPYEYTMDVSGFEIGSLHTVYSRAYDDAGNSSLSDTINFYYKWILLLEDDDEPFERDLDKVYVRSTSTTLEFRVETNGDWEDPHWSPWDDEGEEGSGINCALFLDADQNSNTGLNSMWYSVGDIGPDYVAVIGAEGDSLWSWGEFYDEEYDTTYFTWNKYSDFEYLDLQNNTNHFEVSLRLTDIDHPNSIDIVTANLTMETDTTYWDWSPNEGHVTYEIDGLYVGEHNQGMSKQMIIKVPSEVKKGIWLGRRK